MLNSADPPETGPAVNREPFSPAEQQALYAKREKIFPREVHGLFAFARKAVAGTFFALFYGLAWLNINGHQAVLWDLPARRFHLFGLTFFPQDFILLTGLLIIAALGLFFVTSLAGRVFCGYGCPQTMWTESFLWIERFVEGSRARQMKLDQAPWSLNKIAIKGTKHFIWITFAAWTGFTFVGYFVPIRELAVDVYNLNVSPWPLFWSGFYGFATYLNAGWMREQVCIYMCPYARFQSAMFDRDTLIISYDKERGDPRGSRRRSSDPKALGLGDCIDCTLCVQVCPTGIDIRNGLQYQCINCAACVDICDHVMGKMGYAKGLVKYTTERALHGGKTRILRPRIFIYAALLVVIISAIGATVLFRVPIDLDVIRDRISLYRETSEGLVENVYTLRLINMDSEPHEFRISMDADIELEASQPLPPVGMDAYQIRSVPLALRIDPIHLNRTTNDVRFVIEAIDDPGLTAKAESRFIGPIN
ncbi:MAG: cytochrome c oxidase accessory protein CcoG [Gammaproteobacteria bacterium]